MMPRLTALGRTVRRGDQVVAQMSFAGSAVITVTTPDGTPLGRLYRVARSTGRYWVFTALHPYAPTPTDTQLAELPMRLEEAVALLLERADNEGNPHDE